MLCGTLVPSRHVVAEGTTEAGDKGIIIIVCRRLESAAMGGAIIDKIIAHFEGKPFDEKTGTEPGLITKENVDDPNLWGNAAKKK